MFNPINPPSIPASPHYSHATEVHGPGRLLFISGQVGVLSDGTVPDNVEDQARQVNQNLQAVLMEASMDVSDIVKMTIYLTDPQNLGPFMESAQGFLADPPPATTLLIVNQLADPRLLIEIEAVAAKAS